MHCPRTAATSPSRPASGARARSCATWRIPRSSGDFGCVSRWQKPTTSSSRWTRRCGPNSTRAYEGADALALLLALRRWNVALIRAVVPAALDKPLTHPERGVMTYKVLLETMAGHDLHHVGQLEKLAGQ